MSKILIVLTKDLVIRKSHWFLTTLEIFLPVGLLILLNITPLPQPDPPINEYMDDLINKSCSHEIFDIFTKIIYEPSNNLTRSLISNVKCLGGFQDIKPGDIDHSDSHFKVGVKFKTIDMNPGAVPNMMDYELYPTANYWGSFYQLWKDPYVDIYSYAFGPLKKFVILQQAIDYSFLGLNNITSPKITFQNMNLVSSSPKVYAIIVTAAFFLGFSLMVPGIVGRLVQEKSSGAKELMLIMGLKRWHLWGAKILDCIILFGIVQIFIVIFLYVPMTENSRVLSIVSPVWTWFYFVYTLSGIVVFLFFMSCFFTNSTIAVYLTQVIWVLSFILYSLISLYSSKISRTVWICCCLLPHFCFFTGLSILLDFDFYGKPVKFTEILSRYPNYPSLRDVVFMVLLDIIIYSALTWYLEQVKPGKFGIPKPYNFCFQKSYWFPKKEKSGHGLIHKSPVGNEDFERVPDNVEVGISIVNLSKEYKKLSKGSLLAVDNVSIDFYSGEISALLGHNGAGKTTIFSVISGLTYPTSGKVLVNGYDMAENTDEARSSLGLCPQHDMLFPDLNAYQILCFFGRVKGLSRVAASMEADDFIRKLKLSDVKSTPSSKLSGGQKRKVSLAIALIGGSKVVLLDEPTSGLDPEIRREIWEILLELRGSRTILLTTHFMEEADAVSDRIAIMDHGRIKCYGTPMYLKSKYGSGYTLSIVVNNTEKCNEMVSFVQEFVKTARFKSRNVATLMFQLPQEEVNNFPGLLSALNDLQDSREIHSYSIAFSTFEDVFIRLRGHEEDTDTVIDMVDYSPYKRLNTSDGGTVGRVNNLLLPFYQCYALLIKKWIYFHRNIFSFLFFSGIPLLLLIVNLFILPRIGNKDTNSNRSVNDTLLYSLDLYRDSLVLYSAPNNSKLTKTFENLVAESGSKARRVMNVSEEVNRIFMDNYYIYSRDLAFGVSFDSEDVIKVYYNSFASYMMPISMNVIHNTLLLANSGKSEIKTSVNVKYSHREKEELLTYIRSLQNPLTPCVLADVPDFIGVQVAFFLIGPIKEKIFGAKHLQLMSTSTALYWFTHLLFDLAAFLVYLLVSCVFVAFSRDQDVFIHNIGDVVFALVLWGIGLIFITYLLSSFLNNVGLACVLYLCIYLFFTYLGFNLVQWKFWPDEVQYLHPSCILKLGFHSICNKLKDNYKTTLFIYDVVLFVILVLKDSQLLSNLIHHILTCIFKVNYAHVIEKNAAVKDHEEHVRCLRSRKEFSVNSLIVDSLKRWHFNGVRPRPTVRGISFAVNNGECFGLLGVNGAGKTTSFKMMTGAIPASHGDAFVNGYHLFSPRARSKGLFQIGYCPQYGGIIPTFKGWELLSFFARLRGVQLSDVKRETTKWMEELDLLDHMDTPVECYSGGNQRKLLVGMAVIGDTPVVFLDEPTSGVDPVTRRLIWKAISNLRTDGKSVLLTSHSMDECEAVCTRLAIMVKGHFCCFGEITTLKETFGQGFTVQLKINADASPEEFDRIKKSMSSAFEPGCDLIDEHLTILEYRITNKNIKWDALFMKLINMKENFDKLESFSATATTLEQIFISFARNQ